MYTHTHIQGVPFGGGAHADGGESLRRACHAPSKKPPPTPLVYLRQAS